MNKSLQIIIIIVAIIGVIMLGVYQFTKNSSSSKNINSNTNINSALKAFSWAEYSKNQFFTMKYPKDWQVDEGQLGTVNFFQESEQGKRYTMTVEWEKNEKRQTIEQLVDALLVGDEVHKRQSLGTIILPNVIAYGISNIFAYTETDEKWILISEDTIYQITFPEKENADSVLDAPINYLIAQEILKSFSLNN